MQMNGIFGRKRKVLGNFQVLLVYQDYVLFYEPSDNIKMTILCLMDQKLSYDRIVHNGLYLKNYT